MPLRLSKQPEPSQETIAARTRRIADRVENLPHEVVAAFASADRIERMDRIRHIGTVIIVDMQAVVSWLERRRSPETAGLLIQQVNGALRETLECVIMEIPEYVGGIRRPWGDNPSPGALRTGELLVQSTLVASRLVDWANDMEKEEELERKAADDNSAFRPAKEFVCKEFPTAKAVRDAALNPKNQIRTKKPSKNRMQIHAGDWKAMESRRAGALDLPAAVVDSAVAATQHRRDEIDQKKKAK